MQKILIHTEFIKLDALRNARTEQVKLEISGPLSPVKVLPTEGSDFLYLVLPVRFKND